MEGKMNRAEMQEVKDTDRVEFERLYERYSHAASKEKEYKKLKEEYKKPIIELMSKLGYDTLVVPGLYTVDEQCRQQLDKQTLIMELAKNGVPAEVVHDSITNATKKGNPYKVVKPIKTKQ